MTELPSPQIEHGGPGVGEAVGPATGAAGAAGATGATGATV